MVSSKSRLEIASEKIRNVFRMMMTTRVYELSSQKSDPKLNEEWWNLFIETMPKISADCDNLALIKVLSHLKLKNPVALMDLFLSDEKIPQKIKEMVCENTYLEILKFREVSIQKYIEFLTLVGMDFQVYKNDNAVKLLDEATGLLKEELKKIEK